MSPSVPPNQVQIRTKTVSETSGMIHDHHLAVHEHLLPPQTENADKQRIAKIPKVSASARNHSKTVSNGLSAMYRQSDAEHVMMSQISKSKPKSKSAASKLSNMK